MSLPSIQETDFLTKSSFSMSSNTLIELLFDVFLAIFRNFDEFDINFDTFGFFDEIHFKAILSYLTSIASLNMVAPDTTIYLVFEVYLKFAFENCINKSSDKILTQSIVIIKK